ncbi:MAG: DNA-binding transcriptional regulator ModE [Candidatus Methanofastidiosum methylothiophilum]|jgi:molybdate transport system regulatory protein|uniref:DNA-binding transcriptional regulator ModE n=1 Tax=Candidatus Methanofastidiosum methylothiophilum TaxID=1705564 RepID=A0A150J9X5_9EURY|nr:MAG: DNA-binding transcriptional regulator ModE [Candidatus Methanofastidiosum methylthiophilus]NMC76002.1 LysR family transcriptional regulator [Candidatus Methanofastidiosa archaeon]
MKHIPKFKLWLEDKEKKYILGKGTAELLLKIKELNSIADAANYYNISYAHAWRKIRTIEKSSGHEIISRTRGGKGGGHSELTEFGENILSEYLKTKEALDKLLKTL